MKPNRRKTIAFALFGALAGLALLWLLPIFWPERRPQLPSRLAELSLPGPTAPAIDLAAWRARAWSKIEVRLDAADAASNADIDRSLASIDEFFAARKPGARPFAEAVLSLRGKWRFVKAKLPFADGDGHAQFLQEKLEEHLFRPDDLKKLLESCVAGYLTRVKGLENQLLVQIRADLSENELAAAEAVPALQNPELFAREFQKLQLEVAAMAGKETNFTIGKEVAILVGSEVATVVAMRVGLAVAQRLGVSAGILGAGAAAGWATFGVGLVACIVLDFAVDGVLRVAGHDPEGQVEAKINETLGSLKSMIVNGVPEANVAYRKLRRMETEDPDAGVRAECKAAADRIDRGGSLGLRHELTRLHELRARVRREALRRLIQESDTEANGKGAAPPIPTRGRIE